MDCTYCYECNKMVRSTSYDVLDGIVNFIVEKQRSCSDKTVSIVTHGGEPLIEFDKIQYFIKRLNEKVKNVQYIITTNATLLTDLMIDFLSQHYSEISVSIDGIQSAHDANRVFANKKGSYAVVVEKAKKLLEKRRGQGCADDCTEKKVWVGKLDGNTQGCVYYDTAYTPKTTTWW